MRSDQDLSRPAEDARSSDVADTGADDVAGDTAGPMPDADIDASPDAGPDADAAVGCTAAGEPCDASEPDHGEFTCIDLDGTGGTCLAKCEDPDTAGDCAASHYCRTADGYDVCVPAECSSDSECNGGTCLDFDNDYSECLPSGALSEGAPCDPSNPQCAQGTYCRPTSIAAGTCERICDPWAASPGCPAGEYCAGFATPRTGVCTDDVDTSAPHDAFSTCDTVGAACNDAIACFDVGSQTGCLKYCRPGAGDCAGVTDASGGATLCDNYAFGGDRAVGVCWPPCDPNDPNPCAEGVCVDQLCRTPCTPGGNAADDCCDGDPSCEFQCAPDTSLCE